MRRSLLTFSFMLAMGATMAAAQLVRPYQPGQPYGSACHSFIGMFFAGPHDGTNRALVTNGLGDLYYLNKNFDAHGEGGTPSPTNYQITDAVPCGNGLARNYQIHELPGFGVMLAQFTLPGTADVEPKLEKGEATSQQMSEYQNEAHKVPPKFHSHLQDLADNSGEKVSVSSVGLLIDNGELVWHVGIAKGLEGAKSSPGLEARIRAEFAKFTTKKVVFEPNGIWFPARSVTVEPQH
jgi:hypothetical protein